MGAELVEDKNVEPDLVRQTKKKVKHYNTEKWKAKEMVVPRLFTPGKFRG